MTSPLSKHHQQTYDAIFRHPLAHNLDRRDVIAMLGSLAEVSEEPNGNVLVNRGGQSLVLHASSEKAIANADELMSIRHFLERSGGAADAAPVAPEAGMHFLVVIDHREARIFRTELHNAVPQRITPLDPHGFGRNLHNNQADADGKTKPELRSFYESIAKTLHPATEILLFGAGTGSSSAMEQLLAELKKYHHPIASRVVGTVTIDASHLTEDQLLKEARAFYAQRRAAAATA